MLCHSDVAVLLLCDVFPPQKDLEEVQTLLKKETTALEVACASRDKVQADLNKVSFFFFGFVFGRFTADGRPPHPDDLYVSALVL